MTSSKNIFQESAIYYEKWLKNSGYKSKLQYQQLKENNQNKKNIGRIFIILTSKHFSPSHKFVKIFNKNTIKHSYSCILNIRLKINGHNKNILQPKPTKPQKLCHCLVKEDFPMNGLCLASSILY